MTRRPLDDMGLSLSGHSLVWGLNHGWFRWTPMWAKHPILLLWNRVTCFFWGHDETEVAFYKADFTSGAPCCLSCCAKLKVDGHYPTQKELTAQCRRVAINQHNMTKEQQNQWALAVETDQI